MITPSTSYAGRQVDVELLQTITVPAGTQQMHISNVRTTPKFVTGPQKALQRYCYLLLQQLGSVRFSQQIGTTLLQSIMSGLVGGKGGLMSIFAFANADVLALMRTDDQNVAQFGTVQPDEQISTVTVDDITIDYQTGTISLTLAFSFQSGSTVTYVLPLATT